MRKKQEPIINIDKRSVDSAADQIANQIKSIILTHRFTPLLSDIDYISTLTNVSSEEVKKAFNILVKNQIFDIEDDDETYFVNYQEIATVDNKIVYAITDVLKELKQQLEVKVISKEVFKGNSKEIRNKGFNKDTKVFKQRRIYLGDSNPKSYMELYFSMDVYPYIEKELYQKMPYYDIIDLDANSSKMIRKRTSRSIKLPDEISSYLGQSPNSVGFYSQEHYYNNKKELMLYVDMYMNINYFVRLKE